MDEEPQFYKVSIMFREMLKDAGPTTMEEALSCLHGMVNTASVKLNEIGGQRESEDFLDSAWANIYDAEKAMKP